mmetsp:Transcript_23162/g.37017  ORF Transcript_23162/g.37017 Transcript_23162/m.37017 type:complete len:80 (+) Transcript_23162:443-682(+)
MLRIESRQLHMKSNTQVPDAFASGAIVSNPTALTTVACADHAFFEWTTTVLGLRIALASGTTSTSFFLSCILSWIAFLF